MKFPLRRVLTIIFLCAIAIRLSIWLCDWISMPDVVRGVGFSLTWGGYILMGAEPLEIGISEPPEVVLGAFIGVVLQVAAVIVTIVLTIWNWPKIKRYMW